MYIHTTPRALLVFTDKAHAFEKEAFYGCPSSHELLKQQPFAYLQNYGATHLVVADQTHGIDGLIITSRQQADAYKPYSSQADFIVTNVPNVALGVATADCLPIVLYDPTQHVIAVVHAGWQGTVKGVAVAAVQTMHTHFGTQPVDIQAFFGPSASVDAYEVGADFGKNISNFSFIHEVFINKDGKYYFNVPLYNQLLLQQIGVRNFNRDYNDCTITHEKYCSYRREKGLALRQLTVAILKNSL